MLHSWASTDDEKTVASFQALIISSRPQVNLSPTRPKSSCGRRKARPVAQVTRAYSQAKLTSISLLSPPTCALACSSKSLSYSRVSPAACSFNAAKSFLVLSSSAGMKTKPEKVNCDLFTHVSWASGSFFLIFWALIGHISNSPYCLPYSSCDVSFENLVLDALIIP